MSFVYLLFMSILRCPSLVDIPNRGHGNLMSVLEAPWVQTIKRLVMFSIFKQKPRKQQQSKDNSPSSHNIQNTINLELRIVVRIFLEALKRTSTEYFAAIVGLQCCFISFVTLSSQLSSEGDNKENYSFCEIHMFYIFCYFEFPAVI